MSTLITLPDLRSQYAERGAQAKKNPLTGDERIVYNSSTRRFEINRGSCWSCCFSASELARNARTWTQFKQLLITMSGKQNVDAAFSKAKTEETGELTLGQYEALKKSVEDITALQPRAAAICRSLRLYDMYLNTDVSERDPKLERTRDLGARQLRVVQVTGGDMTKGTELFDRQKMISRIKELPCDETVNDGIAEAIADSIERDLEKEGQDRISRDELNRRTMKYLKQAEYQLQQPYGWDTVGGIAKKRITQLDLEQYKLLFTIAETFEETQVESVGETLEGAFEKKDHKGDQFPSHSTHQRKRSRGVSNYQRTKPHLRVSPTQLSASPTGTSPKNKHMVRLGVTFDSLERSPSFGVTLGTPKSGTHESLSYELIPSPKSSTAPSPSFETLPTTPKSVTEDTTPPSDTTALSGFPKSSAPNKNSINRVDGISTTSDGSSET